MANDIRCIVCGEALPQTQFGTKLPCLAANLDLNDKLREVSALYGVRRNNRDLYLAYGKACLDFGFELLIELYAEHLRSIGANPSAIAKSELTKLCYKDMADRANVSQEPEDTEGDKV